MYRNIHSHNNKNAHFTAQKQDCHHATKKGQKPKFPTPYRPKIPHFISSHPPSSAPHLSLITSPLHHHHHIPLRHHLITPSSSSHHPTVTAPSPLRHRPITHSPSKHCPFSNNASPRHHQCIASPPSTHRQATIDALSSHRRRIVSTWPMYGLHKKKSHHPMRNGATLI